MQAVSPAQFEYALNCGACQQKVTTGNFLLYRSRQIPHSANQLAAQTYASHPSQGAAKDGAPERLGWVECGLLQDGGVGEVLGDAGLALGGAGLVDAGSLAIDGYAQPRTAPRWTPPCEPPQGPLGLSKTPRIL
jgi:hypothetical protein